MAADSDDRFDVFFAGECLEGQVPEHVRDAVQRLFKADDAKVARLFSGQAQVIRRACDHDTALQYQRALKQAGARPIIRRSAGSEPAENASDALPLSLAAPGSDVLRPDERARTTAAEVDTSHLELSEAGTPLAHASPPPTPAPVPDFDLADVGADLAPGRSAPPPPPDTGSLSLADPQQDLSDCAPSPSAAPAQNLDHLTLADPGTPLREPRRNPAEDVAPPDVSHLHLRHDDATE